MQLGAGLDQGEGVAEGAPDLLESIRIIQLLKYEQKDQISAKNYTNGCNMFQNMSKK